MHSFWVFLSKADVFNYIEFFYNSKRRHGKNNGISPQKLESLFFEHLNTAQ